MLGSRNDSVEKYKTQNSTTKKDRWSLLENGEKKVVSAAHGLLWDFKANPDHLKAHINMLKYGERRIIAPPEPSLVI